MRKLDSSCLSVCPYVHESVRPLFHPSRRIEQNQSSRWGHFHGIRYLSISPKPVGKTQASLKPDKNNAYFTYKTHVNLRKYLAQFFCKMRNFSHKFCRENQNTHPMINTFFQKITPFKAQFGKYGRSRQRTDENIIWRICILCWIHRAIDTHSKHVINIAFPRQQWLRDSVTMSPLHVQCLPCCS